MTWCKLQEFAGQAPESTQPNARVVLSDEPRNSSGNGPEAPLTVNISDSGHL